MPAATSEILSRETQDFLADGVYYFSSHKGRQERVRIAAPTRASISAVLGDLRDVIFAGQFTRTPDENNCRYCDYVMACGSRANLQAERKAEDARFQAFARLAAHE